MRPVMDLVIMYGCIAVGVATGYLLASLRRWESSNPGRSIQHKRSDNKVKK